MVDSKENLLSHIRNIEKIFPSLSKLDTESTLRLEKSTALNQQNYADFVLLNGNITKSKLIYDVLLSLLAYICNSFALSQEDNKRILDIGLESQKFEDSYIESFSQSKNMFFQATDLNMQRKAMNDMMSKTSGTLDLMKDLISQMGRIVVEYI